MYLSKLMYCGTSIDQDISIFDIDVKDILNVV